MLVLDAAEALLHQGFFLPGTFSGPTGRPDQFGFEGVHGLFPGFGPHATNPPADVTAQNRGQK
jgi:hypothetical protein